MDEIWKPINGFENRYEISNFGNVISNSRVVITKDGYTRNYRQKKLKLKPCKCRGYTSARLYRSDGSYLHIDVHRLVALHFIPNPMGLPIVNHIDSARHNNHVNNLEWVTCKDNILHMGAHSKGREKLKKKVYQYNLDGTFIKAWLSATDAAANGYNRSGISQVCNGLASYYKGYYWSFQ